MQLRKFTLPLAVLILFFFSLSVFAEDAPPPIKTQNKKKTKNIPSSNPPVETEFEDRNSLLKEWDIPMDKKEYAKRRNRFLIGGNDFNTNPWPLPSTSLFIPVGFGAQWGDLFTGISFESRTRFSNNTDAIASLGFGLGNAEKYVGLDVVVTMHDLHLFFNSIFTLSLKLHHLFSNGTAIAFGRNNAFEMNGAQDQGKAFYGAVSHAFFLQDDPKIPFSLIVIHAGAGNGQFRSEKSYQEDKETLGVFGGFSARILEPLNALVNWSQDLAIGVSVTPFQSFPFVITVGAVDITGHAGDGIRYAFSFAWGDSIFSDTFPINFGQKKKS